MPMTATAPNITLAPNAIAFAPANYDSQLGMGGYAYEYADSASTSCLNGSVFCAGGTVAAVATGLYGAGIGVALNQLPNTTTKQTYVPTGKSGVMYGLSNLPAGTVMIIDNNGTFYQAPLTTASGMVPWSSFKIQTPVGDAGATPLSGPPTATFINFQVNSAPTMANFNFCVTALAFY